MSKFRYGYGDVASKRGFCPDQLAAEIAAAGLPPCVVFGSGHPSLGAPAPVAYAGFAEPLTGAQRDALDRVIWRHAPLPAAAHADELGELRRWVAEFKGHLAAATSLADLKARVAPAGGG